MMPSRAKPRSSSANSCRGNGAKDEGFEGVIMSDFNELKPIKIEM
jgi:hypothetical protein